MRARLNIRLFLGILLVLAACAPASTPTTVQVPELDYSLDAVTGITEVDNVLAAVASGDHQRLITLIKYTSAPCTNAEGMGGPPKCRKGEAEGTVSEVLPFISSEGHHLRKDEIKQWQGVDATGLYAIYRVAENAQVDDEYFPAGEYAVILKTADGLAVSLRIADGGIVRVDDLFNVTQESLEAMIQQDAEEVILAPKVR